MRSIGPEAPATEPPTVLPVVAVAVAALGHLGALLVLPREPSLGPLVALELLVVVAVVVLCGWLYGSRRFLSVFVVGYAGAMALAWVVLLTQSALAVAGLVVVLTLTLAGYGLHRYELVSLGLVEGQHE